MSREKRFALLCAAAMQCRFACAARYRCCLFPFSRWGNPDGRSGDMSDMLMLMKTYSIARRQVARSEDER